MTASGTPTVATATSGEREVRRSTRSGLVGLAGAAVNGLLGFVLTVVIVRGLGPAGSGAMFTAIGVVAIVGVLCCAGADTALVWALPRRTRGPDGDAARLLPVALAPTLLLTVAVAAAGVALSGTLAPVLFDTGTTDGDDLLRLAFAGLPFVVAMTVLLAAVRAVRPVAALVAVQYVLVPAARPALVGAALVAGAGVTVAFAGWLAPVALAVLACVALLVGPLGLTAGTRLRPVRADWHGFWGFALPRAASATIDASSMWLTVLLTAALAGQAAAGVIGAVGRYALAGLLVMQGLRVSVAPQLSRLLGQGRTAEAAAVYQRITAVIIALSWPGYLLLAVFAPGFLRLFGADFTTGSAAMAVLAGAMLVNSGTGIVQTLLLMSGSSGRHLLAAATGLLLNVGLALVLIPPHGALGAAVAWTVGIVVENLIATAAARRVVGEPLVTRTVLRTAVLAAAGTAVLAGAGAAVAGRGVAGLFLTLGVAALLAVVLLLHPGVRRRARAAVPTLLGRGPR
ncbi:MULTISPECIES: lipopolysaccharide biosynthesis protein [Micromonospora]|uniref:Lipopolysaccharide biosynthesis protein n=1 Tax=Micromonospora solifontis TaxID=2487138 RepID=A0ABX9WM14_9ACTN|nr:MULTISPECIES: polysaccharide biosynthesis C-terminal domain-containing protein [Micromonospora]NES13477.1 lipopolysaccharide biosynthesis protein [Micromonospora sp. PPF5-17B]NES35601.1 lipopolysaccharide biosynthesis protein [Micromonospora solifontis]NES55507.1 lipopolysaccharide biosynthesis protein [Micromonospora sp. PPF5-6]RNM00486.1 lipopolysaccharide biosynthesis protein [Micromonospora solifontis]